MLKLCSMNTVQLDPDSNAALVSCYEGGDAEEDREPFGDLPQQSALGLAAAPYPPDTNGRAEAVVAVGLGGQDGRIVGGWDTRAAAVTGNLAPGDTAIHCTGPDQPAQVLCKQEARTVAILVKDEGGKQHAITLDGKNKSLTILVSGHAISIKEDGIHMTSANGQNGLSITDKNVHLKGNVVLGGMLPIPGAQFAVGPISSWATLSVLAPPAGLVPVNGVFAGL